MTAVVSRGVGMLLHIPALMALVTVPFCIPEADGASAAGFAAAAGLGLGLGQLLSRLFRGAKIVSGSQTLVIAAVGWIAVALCGAVPFWVGAHLHPAPAPGSLRVMRDPLNALFESVSGFTSTGLTVVPDPSRLPLALQWWRSFTEWIGGVGVVVLMLAVVGQVSGIYRLYYSEARSRKVLPSIRSTVRMIWWLYLALTVAAVLALRGVGMSWWDALNHGMTGIATGGFSLRADSFQHYRTPVRLVAIVIMTAGAVSFAVHYQVFVRHRLSALWTDRQHRLFWVLLVSGALLVGLIYGGEEPTNWVRASFVWVSALGTCGFSPVDLSRSEPLLKALLSIGMIVGGTAGSTVGGIKLARLVTMGAGMRLRLAESRRSPHQLVRYSLDGEVLSRQEADRRVESASLLALLWLLTIYAGSMLLIAFEAGRVEPENAMFEVCSALGNVGLSAGVAGHDMSVPGKIGLILLMWMGRLEIVPVLVVIVAPLSNLGASVSRLRRRFTR